jgi:hypothetical protein
MYPPIVLGLFTLAARTALGGVFVVAGLMKRGRTAALAKTMRDFGLPAATSGPAAALLPWAEIALGVMALVNLYGVLASAVLLCLLGAFTVAIAINLVRGRRPACNCFGDLSSTPITWWLVGRNVALAGLAVLVCAAPETSARALVRAMASSAALPTGAFVWLLGLSGIVCLQSLVVVWVAARHGSVLQRLEAMDQEAAQGRRPVLQMPAPPFQVRDSAGRAVGLDDLLARGHDLLLLFVDAGCSSCADLMTEVERWQRELDGHLSIVVITKQVDVSEWNGRYAGVRDVFVQDNHKVSNLYGIHGTPAAVFVRRDGVWAGPASFGRAAIMELVWTVESPPEQGSAAH